MAKLVILFIGGLIAGPLCTAAPARHPQASHIEYKQSQKGDENYALHIKNVYLTLPDLSKLILGPVLMDGMIPSSGAASSDTSSAEDCLPPYCFDWNNFAQNPTKKPLEVALVSEKITEKPNKVENVVILDDISTEDRLQLDTDEPLNLNIDHTVVDEAATESVALKKVIPLEIPTEIDMIEEMIVDHHRLEPVDTINVSEFKKPSEDVLVEAQADDETDEDVVKITESPNAPVAVEVKQPQSPIISIRKNNKVTGAKHDFSRVPIRAEDAAPAIDAKVTVGALKKPFPKIVDEAEVLIPVKVVMEA